MNREEELATEIAHSLSRIATALESIVYNTAPLHVRNETWKPTATEIQPNDNEEQ